MAHLHGRCQGGGHVPNRHARRLQGPGGTFRLEFNGVDRTGPITVPDTGGWEHLKPFSHEGVKLVAGREVMKAVMATGGKSGSIGDIDYFKFVKQ